MKFKYINETKIVYLKMEEIKELAKKCPIVKKEITDIYYNIKNMNHESKDILLKRSIANNKVKEYIINDASKILKDKQKQIDNYKDIIKKLNNDITILNQQKKEEYSRLLKKNNMLKKASEKIKLSLKQ